MKKILIAVLLVASFLKNSKAQNVIVLDHHGCGFIHSEEPHQVEVSDPSNEALEYVKRICVATGINQDFVVKQGLVANAYSTTNDAHERIIIYNPNFFSNLNSETYKIAVLAHEIGHFLNFNIFSTGNSQPLDELQADKYAGNVIARLGLRLADAVALVKLKCPIPVEGNYPAQSDRIDAFTNGFRDAHPNDDATFNFNIKSLLYKMDFGSSIGDVLSFELGEFHRNDIAYSNLADAIECAGQNIKYCWYYLKDSKLRNEIYSYLQNAGLREMVTDDTYIVYYFKDNRLSRISLRIFPNSDKFEKLFFQSLGQDVTSCPYRYQSENNKIHYLTGSSFTDIKSTEIYACNEDGYRFCVHDWWH
nr:hypothetical protein [uncultured Mucilaginibacter sp.]